MDTLKQIEQITKEFENSDNLFEEFKTPEEFTYNNTIVDCCDCMVGDADSCGFGE